MSSVDIPWYSLKMSCMVDPCANRLRTNSTVSRVPLITGLPIIILVFIVILSSNSLSVIMASSNVLSLKESFGNVPTCSLLYHSLI